MNPIIQSPTEFKEGTKYCIKFESIYSIYDHINDKIMYYIEDNEDLCKYNGQYYYYLGKDRNNNNKLRYIFVNWDFSEYLYVFKYNNYEFYFNVITNDKGISCNEAFVGQLEKKCHIYNIIEESTEYILK